MSQFSQSDPPDGETPAELPLEGDPGERKRVVLFFLHRGGAEMVTLVPGTPLVVGRKPPSDLCVRDAKLSRRHARFSLLQDGLSVLVEDLDSTNGTWLGTQRIQSTRITFGQEVRLGGVLAHLQVFKDSPGFSLPGETPHGRAAAAGRAMRALMEQVKHVASLREPIVIHGEAGTGKEVLAEVLHKLGPRADKPMKRIICGALLTDRVESTLFGHERGAFTGALQQHKGPFEEAHGGIVFLDEIGELAQPAQTALLRVLETGRLTRVGSTQELSVDVRVIAATHRDLHALVQTGQFLEDLYYRLSPLTLELPPLRERTDEIETLALHFLQEANREAGGRVKGIAPSAMEQLLAYSWPGNVRELKNVISSAVLISRSSHISVHDLPARVVQALGASQSPPSASPTQLMEDANTLAGDFSAELRPRVQRYEAQIIRETLESENWNRAKAARLLKLPLRTLAHRIKVLGIKKN
jgi:two-component system response regulator AtoC